VLVTLAMLGLLAWMVDLQAVARLVLRADATLWLAGLGLSLLNLLLMAWRWRILLAHEGLRPSQAAASVLYLQAGFYTLFLPSAVGGDVYRAVRMRELMGGTGRAAVNLLVERLLGVWVLVLWGGLGLVWQGGELLQRFWLPAVAVAAALVGGTLMLGSAGVARVAVRWLRALGVQRVAEALERLGAQWRGYLSSPGVLVRAALATAVSQAVAILGVWVLGLAVGVPVGLQAYWVSVPVAWLLGLLPSLAGIGPREGGLVVLLSGAGASPEQATAVAGLMLSVQVARSLLGLVALSGRWIRSR